MKTLPGFLWFLIVVLLPTKSLAETKCYTIKDVLDAECNVGCKRGGYKLGVFVEIDGEKGCQCSDLLKYENLTGKTLTLSGKGRGTKTKATNSSFFSSDD
jgi:hypothetical protein